MKYSYKPLERKFQEKGWRKSDLIKECGISSRTIAKIAKGERIQDVTLEKIGKVFGCKKEDLYVISYENVLLDRLLEEKRGKISNGIYHELQIRMAYNSNHIEGSKLNEEQTRYIFETRTIGSSEGIPVDDIIETNNHFRAFDYVLEHVMDPLSEDMIKYLHYLLKMGTKDSDLEWFALGDYKRRANIVGGRETTSPNEAYLKMKELLKDYLSKDKISLEDVVDFHVSFERIHPFRDGNGRTGRLIAFKECLKNNIIPFLIEDSKKYFYYRGLSNYNKEKGWLLDTCLDGQNVIKKMMEQFDIPLVEK